jgi:hypothetical protein
MPYYPDMHQIRWLFKSFEKSRWNHLPFLTYMKRIARQGIDSNSLDTEYVWANDSTGPDLHPGKWQLSMQVNTRSDCREVMPITDRVIFAIHHPPTLSLEQMERMEYHRNLIEAALSDISDRMDAWMSLIQNTNDLS